MSKRFFTILLTLVLSLPVSVWAVDTANEDLVEQSTVQSVLEEEIKDIEPEIEYKQPVSKKKIAKKFLAAMGGVAASSFIIFFLLTVYNRLREGYMGCSKKEYEEDSLESPTDMLEAVKIFLEKTKW